jgi:thymidine kinase
MNPQLKVFTGPMFGGKTTRMLAALERYQYQNRNTILFKPKMDRRYSEETVVTHKGQEHKCVLVETGEEIYNLSKDFDVIGCDESFMINGSADALIKLFHQGKTILVSSLQLSSTSEFLPMGYEPFEEMTKIMPWATSIDICPAVCSKCDRDAYYTERLAKEEKKVLVGGAESYQPVCYKHSVMNKK